MAYSPEKNAANSEIIRYDLGWDAINSMLRAGRSLSGHERNCCFLNTHGGRFADVSGVTGLDFADDGRVLALADWDYDGDVDFWVANRSGPQIRYLQNELDANANSHFVKLRLEGVRSNRDAIGARVDISYTRGDSTETQSQMLRAGEGYLAQNSKWLHFGLDDAQHVDHVEIYWPSGERQSIPKLAANSWYHVREGDEVRQWTPPSIAPQSAADLEPPPVSDKARIVLLNPIPLVALHCDSDTGDLPLTEANGRAKLVNLWATWCQPCLQELSEWKQIAPQLSAAGVDILAINADEETAERPGKVQQVWNALQVPYRLGLADEQLVAQFDTLQRSLLSRQRPLPLPSSFLIDGEGRLRVVYKGPVDVATLQKDVQLVNAEPADILAAAIPFPGRWLVPPGGSTPLQLTVKYIDNDLTDTARTYIESIIAQRGRHPEYLSAAITNLYGAILLDAKEYEAAREAFELSLELDPNDRQAHIELGTMLVRASRGAQAEPHFEHVLRVNAKDPELIYFLGVSRLQQGKLDAAREAFTRSAAIRPAANVYWQLGNVAVGLRDARLAIESYERALELAPDLAKQANNLAWLLSTVEDATLRNGKRAVELAERIANERQNDPSALDTLAAACAEAGDFERAQSVARQAITAASNAGQDSLAQKMEARLEKYRVNRPYHASL